jgi:hypothetical protein
MGSVSASARLISLVPCSGQSPAIRKRRKYNLLVVGVHMGLQVDLLPRLMGAEDLEWFCSSESSCTRVSVI